MDFEEYVNNLKRKFINKNNIIFVCIGNSKVLWDSIGPYVGSFLKQKIGKEFVIGDIDNNICDKLDLLYYYFKLKNKCVVAIDTAIGEKIFLENIFINSNPIKMGLAVNKNKGEVGDISIKIAIPDKNIDINYIHKMTEFVGNGITKAFKNDKLY